MADPYYGPGGTGYYIDPTTGKRYFQVRYSQGPDAYDPNALPSDSRLIYDPAGGPTYGPNATNPNTGSGGPTTDPTNYSSGDAQGILRARLDAWGMGALADRAWAYYQTNPNPDMFVYWLRQQPEYNQRFVAMKQLIADGHAMSEADYIATETAYKQVLRQGGLPSGFYDTPDDFARFLTSQTSPAELANRVQEYTNFTYNLPPLVRDEFARQYGLSNGDITAYIIDPTRALPILHNQMLSAQVGAGARQAGFGNLTRSESESIAQLGVDFNAALQGFGQLQNMQQLFTPLLGDQGEQDITREQQLGAAFGGDTAAQRAIQQQGARRVAAFAGGGSYANGGLGKAST